MTKLTVVEAAEALGISKEAVYNRLRRNTLNSVMENGLKYVILNGKETQEVNKKPAPRTQTRKRSMQEDNRYIIFLQEQIGEMKEKIKSLEADKERLIKEKEALLVESRSEVERIYNQKDKQLKQVLTVITRPLLTYMRGKEAIDAEYEDLTPYERGLVLKTEVGKWVNLEEYMHEKGYSYKKKKSINSAIMAQVGTNKNIKEEHGIFFIKRGKKIKEILRNKS